MLYRMAVPSVEIIQRGSLFDLGRVRRFEHVRIDLPLPGHSNKRIKVLHLSDLHIHSKWNTSHDRLLELVAQIDADVVCFTGDLIHGKLDANQTRATVERLLPGLVARHGLYFVRGNHDGDLPVSLVRDLGAIFIEGDSRLVTIEGRTIEIVGVVGRRRSRIKPRLLNALLAKIQPGGHAKHNEIGQTEIAQNEIAPHEIAQNEITRIVLTHFPDSIRKLDSLKGDLFLAGHTHGGQICLPGRIPLIRHDTLSREMCAGLHRYGQNSFLHVSRGLGFSGIDIRMFCPAEVVEILI